MWEISLDVNTIENMSGCLVSKVFQKGVQVSGSKGTIAVQDVDRLITSVITRDLWFLV